jgi:hypothetical protein
MDNPPPPPPPPPATPPPPPPGQWAPGEQPPQVPWTPMPMSATPPKKRRSELVRLGIVLAIVVAVVIGFFLLRDILPGQVGSLEAGNCFDLPASNVSVADVQHHLCSDLHDAEVFAVLSDATPDGQPYPGRSYFSDQLSQRCGPAASTYIGADINQQAELDFGMFFPTSESWASGGNKRRLTCYLYRVDEAKLTVTLKGTGQSASP